MRFSIIKREPPYFFENMHEDLNRFLKDTFGDMSLTGSTNKPFKGMFRPALEIKEKRDRYSVKIELPNVKKEDIDVELTENGIIIKAESKFEECREDENIKTTEFRYGDFYRTVPLEHPINPDEAKSKFDNGILYIELPKLHEDKKEDVKKLKIE